MEKQLLIKTRNQWRQISN